MPELDFVYAKEMTEKEFKGKSRDSRDRLTFDVGGLRERLKAQTIEPSQSLASVVRMALIEWLDQKENAPDSKKSAINRDNND